MYSDAPLADSTICENLQHVWGVSTAAIAYQRVGFGSFHWSVTATDGIQWFVTADRHDSPFAVPAAYNLSRSLADAGLEFVRAPIPTAAGSATVSVGGLWLSLWPWLEGRTGSSHHHRDQSDLAATLAMAHRLHNHRTIEPDPALVENWKLSGRDELWSRVAEGGGDGPYAAEVFSRVDANRSRITHMLTRYDELAGALTKAGTEFVITHGEPHAGNVIHTASGPMLIDWDTARWAPKERDLWSLTDYAGWQEVYGEDDISADALEIYRLQWDLTEIIDFVGILLASPRVDPDTEVAANALRALLPV